MTPVRAVQRQAVSVNDSTHLRQTERNLCYVVCFSDRGETITEAMRQADPQRALESSPLQDGERETEPRASAGRAGSDSHLLVYATSHGSVTRPSQRFLSPK